LVTTQSELTNGHLNIIYDQTHYLFTKIVPKHRNKRPKIWHHFQNNYLWIPAIFAVITLYPIRSTDSNMSN